MRPSNRSDAFTLIELLIVVAIIAILAAIAVPNFLEAQMRSKVSRAKTDMRSISVGLESYKVDRNRYPPGYTNHPSNPVGTINPRIRRLVPLTTPVAYLTSVPSDIFSRDLPGTGQKAADVQAFIYADRDSYGRVVTIPFGPNENGVSDDEMKNLYYVMWGVQYQSSEWLLRSRGPLGGVDDGAALGNSVDATDAYDATNGTVSTGNIFLLGPGVGFLGN